MHSEDFVALQLSDLLLAMKQQRPYFIRGAYMWDATVLQVNRLQEQNVRPCIPLQCKPLKFNVFYTGWEQAQSA